MANIKIRFIGAFDPTKEDYPTSTDPILVGDFWIVTHVCVWNGSKVEVGEHLVAKVDDPEMFRDFIIEKDEPVGVKSVGKISDCKHVGQWNPFSNMLPCRGDTPVKAGDTWTLTVGDNTSAWGKIKVGDYITALKDDPSVAADYMVINQLTPEAEDFVTKVNDRLLFLRHQLVYLEASPKPAVEKEDERLSLEIRIEEYELMLNFQK